MKQIIFILLAFILIGCEQNHKKNYLLGTWEFVSGTDMETGEVKFLENDEKFIIVFKSDSVYEYDDPSSFYDDSSPDEVYAWTIKNDSLFYGNWEGVYVKELTKVKLVLDVFGGFLGDWRIEYKRINEDKRY
ncbi:lipocalin family protein [Aestuariivivens sediminis]|uniref:lipocalin family protein n=1 Tax=Aestuariivivens sediminis TaxID=2913557 RepID=UPI001F5AF600|nr:lipocalin family protein [Aestuariivivens sediminis]